MKCAQFVFTLLLQALIVQAQYYYYGYGRPAAPARYSYGPIGASPYYRPYYGQARGPAPAPAQVQKPAPQKQCSSSGSQELELLSKLHTTTHQISETKQNLLDFIHRAEAARLSIADVPRMLVKSAQSALSLSADLGETVKALNIECTLKSAHRPSISNAISKLQQGRSELSTIVVSLFKNPKMAVSTLAEIFSSLESTIQGTIAKIGGISDSSQSDSSDSSSSSSDDSACFTDFGSSDSASTSSADATATDASSTDNSFNFGSDSSSSTSTATASVATIPSETPATTAAPIVTTATAASANGEVVYTFSTNEVYTITNVRTENVQGKVFEKTYTFYATDEYVFTNTLRAVDGPINSILAQNLVQHSAILPVQYEKPVVSTPQASTRSSVATSEVASSIQSHTASPAPSTETVISTPTRAASAVEAQPTRNGLRQHLLPKVVMNLTQNKLFGARAALAVTTSPDGYMSSAETSQSPENVGDQGYYSLSTSFGADYTVKSIGTKVTTSKSVGTESAASQSVGTESTTSVGSATTSIPSRPTWGPFAKQTLSINMHV